MKKIVLIEDDADLYSLIQYNLEKEGFAMVGSQTGKGALELCRRERPDLVILDIMLPGFRRPGHLQGNPRASRSSSTSR